MRDPAVNVLSPVDVLFDDERGEAIPLTAELQRFYGPLAFPIRRPYVISNFVSTVDGVTSLAVPGHAAGGDISGFDNHDRMVMGLLRSVSSAVIVGAGTLRSVPKHVWTPEEVFPTLADEFSTLRGRLNLGASPLNVIVSASGRIDPGFRVFQSGEVEALILTTAAGAERIDGRSLPAKVRMKVCPGENSILAADVLQTTIASSDEGIVLVEGGPRLMGDFFGERLVDDLFLTLAPQIAGRDGPERLGIVAGRVFAPENPFWGRLVSTRRAGSHLFLRYRFERG